MAFRQHVEFYASRGLMVLCVEAIEATARQIGRGPPRVLQQARTLTYLRLSGCFVGLLMNVNTALLKDGLRRFVP